MKKYILTFIILLLTGVNTAWGQSSSNQYDLSTWNNDNPVKYTVTIAEKNYTGSAHDYTDADCIVTYNGTQLTPATDYYITWFGMSAVNETNVGDYSQKIKINAQGSYSGTIVIDGLTRTITPKAITVDGFTLTPSSGNNSIAYNGSAQSPTVTVHDNTRNADLVLNTDYELDNTNPNTASATSPGTYTTKIIGKGNYTGTSGDYEWKIVKSINSSDITVTVDQATYTGAVQTPVVTITDPTNTDRTDGILTAGTDYTITYKGSTLQDAKTYVDEIIITGAGVYSGTRYASFTIDPKDINLCTVEGNSVNFTGSEITPTITVKDGSTTLSSDTDDNTDVDNYTLTVSDAYTYKEPGTYANAITIDGKGNYTGTKNVNFIIDPNGAKNIADGKLLVTSNAIYTGATQVPSASTINVLYDGEPLDAENYTLSYAPNVVVESEETGYKNAQTYSGAITITAKGTSSYGSVTADYVILPCPVSQTTITVDDPYYNASDFTDLDLRNNFIHMKIGDNTITDYYMVTPDKVKEAGTYTLTITGVANSNLIGSTTVTLKVRKALNDPTYSGDFNFTEIPTQIYDGENAVQPEISVYDNGRLLTEGEEYTITYGANTITEGASVGTGTITITGKGAYDPYGEGSPTYVTKEFAIVNEYFTEDNITYHAKSSTTVAVGNKGEAVTTLTGAVAIPATVTLQVTLGETITPIEFQVTGIEAGAFKNCTAITGIDMPHSTVYLEEIENGAFEGCTNLRYIDLCNATNFTPSTLQRNVAASPFYGVPKQALVYLNGTTFKGENYVYKPGTGSDYFCELFKIYDDMGGDQKHFAEDYDYKWAFENRHNFTAYNVENTRMLTADNHYTTCLPYDLPIPTGMKAYTLEATSDKLFGFKEVTGTLTKFTPYVLIPTTSGQLLSTTNAVIQELKEENSATTNPMKLNPVTSGSTTNQFTMGGTMRYMDGTDAKDLYIMQGKDANGVCTWKKISSEVTNSGATPTNPCVLPMRAYIKSGNALSREFMESSFSDGISDFNVTAHDTNYYDLMGRKVLMPQPGRIYIKNGKKIMVR